MARPLPRRKPTIPAEWRWQISQPAIYAALAVAPLLHPEESAGWRLAEIGVICYCLLFVVLVHRWVDHNAFYKVHARRAVGGKVLRIRPRAVLAVSYSFTFVVSSVVVLVGRLRA